MPVLFLIAIVVVLVGIFFAATGRGGELSYEPADHAPLDLGPVSAADVALLRPPTAMWGYNMQVTDEALDQIARAMRERDVTIAYLQEQLAGYERNGSYTDPQGMPARQDAETSDAAGIAATRETPEIAHAAEPFGPGTPAVAGTLEAFGLAEMFEPRGDPEPFGATSETPSTTPETLSDTSETPSTAHETLSDTSGTPDALEPPDAPEAHEARQFPEDPEDSPSPEAGDPLDTSGPPRTPLVLKASAPKPEPHEATQPSQTLQDPGEAHDATEPSAVFRDDEESGETTQPSATLAPDEPPGPQGAFDTHGWWAEQKEAAREEQAHRQVPGEQEGDSMAAAEEQGW